MNLPPPPSKLCVSISKKAVCEIFNNKNLREHNFFELRLDLLSCKDIKKLNRLNAKFIITCRNKELCTNKIQYALKKEKIFAIDVCTDCNYGEKLKAIAQENNLPIILSYHNYSGTPPFDELVSILERMKAEKAAFYKIVTKTKSERDAETIMKLYDIAKGENKLIAFGMGKFARQTRTEALKKGTPFIFVGTGKHTTAHGQPGFEEMKRIVND